MNKANEALANVKGEDTDPHKLKAVQKATEASTMKMRLKHT